MAFEFLFGRAVIRFEARDRGLRAATRRLSRDVKVQTTRISKSIQQGLQGAAQQASAAFGRLGQTVSRVLPGLPPQALAAAAAVGAITVAFVSVTRAASKFQKAFAEVRTLIDESKIATDEIKEALLALPPILGGAEELTKALYQAISAGAEPAAAIELVGTAAKLAAAGLTTVFAAVDILTTTINAYGLEAEEAARISDVLFKTVELGKTTVDRLAGSLGVVIPFAAQLGISIEELSSAVATLTKGGLDTRIAITALRGTFVNFIKQADAFRDAGIDILEVIGEEGLVGALRALREVTGGNIEAIKELVPDARALTAVLALTGNQFEEFLRIQQLVQQATGATEIAFQKQAETFALRSAELGNQFERLKIAIGTGFLAPLTAVVRALTNFIKRIGLAKKAVEGFGETEIGTTLAEGLGRILNPFGLVTKAARLFFGSVETGSEKSAKSLGMVATEVEKLAGTESSLARQREALEKSALAAFKLRQDEIKKGTAVSKQLQDLRDLEAQNRLTQLAIIDADQKANKEALALAREKFQVAKEVNRDILANEVETQAAILKTFEGGDKERAKLQRALLAKTKEFQVAEVAVRAGDIEARQANLADELEERVKADAEKIAQEKKTRRELTIEATRGVAGANLKLLQFERELLGDKTTTALKAAETDKKIAEERLLLEQTLVNRRRILGQVSLQEEIERLNALAANTRRSVDERLAAEAEGIQRTKALREESRNVALRAIRAVRKALEERGIFEATRAEINEELARQQKERGEESEELVRDFRNNIRLNLKDFEGTLKGFGESAELNRALERVGGFGDAVNTALAPDIEPIRSATADIAMAYDDALTKVENRIDEFGTRAKQKLAGITRDLAAGVGAATDEGLRRNLEFEGTRR